MSYAQSENLLVMKDITKIYPNGTMANNNVDFSLRKGEIHALIGENGAGKSTLMKILFGIERPDSGTITFQGKQIKLASSNDAISHGIGMVHQHFKLVPSLTVMENIVLGNEPKKGLRFDKEKSIQIAQDLAKKFNFNVNPTDVVKEISVGQKQKVEILKALYRDTKLLILDEPTAVLAPQETEELFEQLNKMRESGITIIFISHKLKEVKQICDRLTIMRQGRSMGTYNVAELSQQEISRLMVGRDVVLHIDKQPAQPKEVVLKAKNLSWKDETGKTTLQDVSLALRKGEILGIAGVEGSGQQELVRLLTGLAPIQSGSIAIQDNDISRLSIKKRREMGLSYIPEDRLSNGVATNLSIRENVISNIYDSPAINGRIFFKRQVISQRVEKEMKDFDIRSRGPETEVGALSGGNMQKVVVAREFSNDPTVLIVDQPTRGVDVGAIEFIHKKIVEMRDQDCGILLISADLNEILELSDSILVMSQGNVTAYFPDVKEVSEEILGYYMLGIQQQSAEEIGGALHES